MRNVVDASRPADPKTGGASAPTGARKATARRKKPKNLFMVVCPALVQLEEELPAARTSERRRLLTARWFGAPARAASVFSIAPPAGRASSSRSNRGHTRDAVRARSVRIIAAPIGLCGVGLLLTAAANLSAKVSRRRLWRLHGDGPVDLDGRGACASRSVAIDAGPLADAGILGAVECRPAVLADVIQREIYRCPLVGSVRRIKPRSGPELISSALCGRRGALS